MEKEVWTSIIKKKKNFTQVSNDWILDLRLNWDSYRLLCYIDMQPDDWMFYKSKTKKDLWFGEQKYTSCMQQLKSIWYIAHYPQKNDKNKITNRVIELFYCIESRGVPNQGVARPGGGYVPPYNNTELTNTKKSAKKNIKNNGMDKNFPDGKVCNPEISVFDLVNKLTDWLPDWLISLENNKNGSAPTKNGNAEMSIENQPRLSPKMIENNYNNAIAYRSIMDEHWLDAPSANIIMNTHHAMTFLGKFRWDYDRMERFISEIIESNDFQDYESTSYNLMLHIISIWRNKIKYFK